MATKDKHPIVRVKCRVYLEDTDVSGVVYHANYLKYMERARTEFIRNYGLNRNYMLQQQVIFLVRKLEIAYHGSAHLDDVIIASAQIDTMHKYAANFKQQVIGLVDKKLLCSAAVQVVSINQTTNKLVQLPPMGE